MLRPRVAAAPAALLLAASCALWPTVARPSTPDEAAQALERARSLLERAEARAAAAVLEEALPRADAAARPRLLEQLEQAYEGAAREAEAAGEASRAEEYRENLAILRRKPRAAPAPTPPASGVEGPSPAPEISAPAPLPHPEDLPASGDDRPVAPAPRPSAATASPTPGTGSGPTPPAEHAAPPASPPDDAARVADDAPPEPDPEADASPEAPDPADGPLGRADAAFRRRDYSAAGTLYAQLAGEGRLPEDRKEAWAYCRRFEVVRRINARPRTAEQWAALAAEIGQIRALSPNHWYDEYLRDFVSERMTEARRAGARKVVLRGAAPEEEAPARRPAAAAPTPRPAGTTRPATPAPRTRPRPAPGAIAVPDAAGPAAPEPSLPTSPEPAAPQAATPAPAFQSPDLARWQIHDSANFRVYHADPELARRVAQAAEAAREEQTRRWTGHPPRGNWQPVCEIYLYPDARIYSQRTGQPEDSPGFSTSGLSGGRVTARRINLRADHPRLAEAVLPHEVTHIVLAELFPERQIPRWADEGMAVLAEPPGEQHERASELDRPLHGGKIFTVEQLMLMDYPEGRHWPLYYAQSISLTRFLVEQSSPARFVAFVRDAQTMGPEAALRQHYQMNGYADLQERWLAYARTPASDGEVRTASAEPAEAADPPSRR